MWTVLSNFYIGENNYKYEGHLTSYKCEITGVDFAIVDSIVDTCSKQARYPPCKMGDGKNFNRIRDYCKMFCGTSKIETGSKRSR